MKLEHEKGDPESCNLYGILKKQHVATHSLKNDITHWQNLKVQYSSKEYSSKNRESFIFNVKVWFYFIEKTSLDKAELLDAI